MADKDDLVDSAKVDGPSKDAHVLLCIGRLKSSHGIMPEQILVTNALTLPNVVNCNPQIDSLIDQDKLSTGQFIEQICPVQDVGPHLNVEINENAAAMRSLSFSAKGNLELVVDTSFEQGVDARRQSR